MTRQTVLVCYRGRYRPQVEQLAAKLRARGLTVSYDREVLASPDGAPADEVEWIDVGGDDARGDVTWRAPLQQAIAASELVVFLIDPFDQTPNVYNEIAWVTQAGRHAFVIFDTGTASLSEETQGIVISQLNINCAAALNSIEVPSYGYVFFAQPDVRELDARLDVVVNRVEEYLARVRREPPPPIRMDEGVQHVDELASLPLSRARERRDAIQARWWRAFGVPALPPQTASYEAAVDYAYRFEKGAAIEGEFIRPPGSPFRYPRTTEQQRFALTNAIIVRNRPDRREVAPLFALLARQMASIEQTLEPLVERRGERLPLTLLGTLPLTAVDDVSELTAGRDYAIIWVDRAFIDFVYQMCKVTVCSWKLISDPKARRASLSARAEDVIGTLDADPSLAEGFFRCIAKYVAEGVPGASVDGAPPTAYEAPLSLLSQMAERFMIGRGYAWLAVTDPRLAATLTTAPPPATVREARLRQDFLAALFVLTSGAQIDRVDPALALQGCGMPLVCADLIQRAVQIVSPASARALDNDRPTIAERLAMVERAYGEVATAQGLRSGAPGGLTPARDAWHTQELLWRRIEVSLAGQRERGMPLASVWSNPAVRNDLAALLHGDGPSSPSGGEAMPPSFSG